MNQIGKKILDLGCGLNPYEKANIVMDINPVILNLNDDIEKTVHDLNNIPYPFEDCSIDEIYCSDLIEHLQVHVFYFLTECYRILKPGGKMVIWAPNSFHYKARLRYLFGSYNYDTSFAPFHVQHLKPSFLVDYLRNLGFDVKLKRVSWLWRKIGLEQVFPDLFSRNICIEMRKRP